MIYLRNPARARQDNSRLAKGLAGSSVIHALLFALWATAPEPTAAPLDAIEVYRDSLLTMVDVQLTNAEPAFSGIDGPAQAAAGGASSEGGPAGEPPPSDTPDPARRTPPATAPVRSERPDVRPEGRPRPAPIQQEPERARPSTSPARGRTATAPRPTGANRPVERQGTGTESGTGQGTGSGSGRADGGGSGSGAGSGTGSGSDGSGEREVGFAFGNRVWDCPTPVFEGVPGEVTLSLTFRPDGGFVSASGRGGNSQLVRAARDAAGRCRAQALPGNARQVNQTTQATFRFVAG